MIRLAEYRVILYSPDTKPPKALDQAVEIINRLNLAKLLLSTLDSLCKERKLLRDTTIIVEE